ncbi:Flagellar motor switch protein FliG [Maioricimonas rarisocia]|uniref:Flagellar motor switch protein FliG n=1 Tax=Maioricimonas rarisocia TaxID=2528026 RepID=A0A517ZCS0_9PLAN|nr:FliG C-terminal domain-containing protein [Maioricimonas rarisocia]QDU40252.1 Flagellar motor switch protein FliG [Maioricimonas rarisocia]
MAKVEDKAVMILHVLGKDVAESVMERLPPERQTDLRRRLDDLSDVRIPARRQRELLDEFERFFRFVLKQSKPRLKVHSPEETEGDEQEGSTQRSRRQAREEQAEEFVPTENPFADLEDLSVFQVASALEGEQARTIAIVLGNISPERTAEILSLLPEDRREQVIRELSAEHHMPPALLERIAAAIVGRAVKLPPEPPKRFDRIQRIVNVLRALDKDQQRQMLRAIEEDDADTASQILERLYVFEDITTLDDPVVQQILLNVESGTMATALYEADEEIRQKVFSNLSRRAREALQEELEFQGRVSSTQLEQARQIVVQAIAKASQEAG